MAFKDPFVMVKHHCFIIINQLVLWDLPVNYYSISRRQGSTFNLRHSASWHQLSGTLCLQLQKVPLPSPVSRHIWKLNCLQLHMIRSNISSAAGASDSNSRHMAPPINVSDIWHLASFLITSDIYHTATADMVTLLYESSRLNNKAWNVEHTWHVGRRWDCQHHSPVSHSRHAAQRTWSWADHVTSVIYIHTADSLPISKPYLQPAALWHPHCNVLRQRLTIFSSEYYQVLTA